MFAIGAIGQHPDSLNTRATNISGFADVYCGYDFIRPGKKLRPDYLYNT
jgi:hypothetical protein